MFRARISLPTTSAMKSVPQLHGMTGAP